MNSEHDVPGQGLPLRAWGTGLGKSGRAGVVAGLVAVCGALLGGALWLLRTDRDVLFTHLSASDAAVLVAELDRIKQPYELADDSATILVYRAVAYGRLGMCTQATGGTAAWLNSTCSTC